MSNITLFSSSNVPAFARNNELSDTAKALTGGGSGASTKRISIKGGVFRLVAGGKEVASIEDRHLDVVIVRAAPKVSRIFYGGAYDAEKIVRPDCWSNDGEKPDASIEAPQNKTCMGCPQNEAGSGNGNSRACRFQQRLAVVLADNMEGDVLQLTLPATSVFGKEEGDKRPLQAYARFLAAQNPPVNPEQIVTRMKFDTKAESPKLFFAPVRWLTDDEYPTVVDQGNTENARRPPATCRVPRATRTPRCRSSPPMMLSRARSTRRAMTRCGSGSVSLPRFSPVATNSSQRAGRRMTSV